MIVKFFSSKGGGSAKASIDYLLDQKKHNGKAEVLQGNPNLSLAIADSLDYKSTYTVGCLSFEEKPEKIKDQDKREIMERFENTLFPGLEKEQYNITWVEHTDKDRLELNFFIPKTELTTGKRLQPYYDKADRPLVDSFVRVINHDYNLSDPHAPEKAQTLSRRQGLPKTKKEVQEAIHAGIEALVVDGKVSSRADVIGTLEGAGFEIARATPKAISIKTDGQNLRLKGAFYEESFAGGASIRETIEEQARSYERGSNERYQSARERLDSAVSKRKLEYSERYREEQKQDHTADLRLDNDGMARLHHTNRRGYGSDDLYIKAGTQQHEAVESVSGALQGNEQRGVRYGVRNESKQEDETLCLGGQRIQRQQLDDTGRKSADDNGAGLTDERDRNAFRERIERVIRTVRERASQAKRRIKEFAGRKRLDTDELQRNNSTKRANQQAIEHIKQANQSLTKENKKQQERGWGFSR